MICIEELIKDVDLSTDDGIAEVCAKIIKLNENVNDRLDAVLSRQCHIESKMSGIGRALSGLSLVSNDSRNLSDMISHTAELSENVSAKVRRLDEARSRVSECQQRVHDLIDLQLCSQGVITAIKDEDFEKGAAHINRFLSMDQHLLQRTADDVSGSITSVSQAVSTLESAAQQMEKIVSQKFDEAVKKDDLASVERFFKIFPLLGKHNEGIEKFSKYICSKLKVKSQKELRASMDVAKAEKRMAVAFADTLTLTLENIARVIEVNQPIIENFYGYGLLCFMYPLLQKECDEEVRQLILEFQKNRHIQRRITQINDYIRNSGQSSMGHFRNPSGGSVDKLNPKDIDGLIGEITVMHSRAELYNKFMRRRITSDIENSTLTDSEKQDRLKQFELTQSKSDLSRNMQELLGVYLLFERYFMEESVLKAISMDTLDPSQQCSSMVDDVFFIIRKSIRRSISTQSLDGICAVINNAASCLEGDYINAIKSPLKAGYPSGYIDLAQAYNAFQTSIQQGKLQTSDTEHAKINFIAQLNNADISTEYIERLWTGMREEIKATYPAMTVRENDILESCLSGLNSVRDTMKAAVDFGLQQLRSIVLKPRLNTWIDQFTSYNHILNEEELATYEAGETFVQSLIVQLDSLLVSFKSSMSQRNYDALVSIVATDVAARLERTIKKCTFNRLGGLILDQEVRTLGSYLTGAVASWSIRDKIVRLTQIATLLNLEQVSEMSEYWNTSHQDETPAWRLSHEELRSILALRVDFRIEDIRRLKI
ncbi:Conserved oligomeric Golgi complex subunit 4 [Pseudolycoriella hygida]|uniref:Conserved oligomeric Golgi complex subunit 4 n=1 Tax=Pseudolycoriella hygida TaxID=35572 RepID=A0A9Q0S0E6_9DIPT|nr:Conserved oligomeric Golgi complex subunit 4 [Pseudolycoriella hygida]